MSDMGFLKKSLVIRYPSVVVNSRTLSMNLQPHQSPQSNGQAERCGPTLKGLFKKADEDGRYAYLALLENFTSNIDNDATE